MQRHAPHNYFSHSSRNLIITFNQLAKPGGNLKPSPELLSGLSPQNTRMNHLYIPSINDLILIQFMHIAIIHTCTFNTDILINLTVTRQNVCRYKNAVSEDSLVIF